MSLLQLDSSNEASLKQHLLEEQRDPSDQQLGCSAKSKNSTARSGVLVRLQFVLVGAIAGFVAHLIIPSLIYFTAQKEAKPSTATATTAAAAASFQVSFDNSFSEYVSFVIHFLVIFGVFLSMFLVVKHCDDRPKRQREKEAAITTRCCADGNEPSSSSSSFLQQQTAGQQQQIWLLVAGYVSFGSVVGGFCALYAVCAYFGVPVPFKDAVCKQLLGSIALTLVCEFFIMRTYYGKERNKKREEDFGEDEEGRSTAASSFYAFMAFCGYVFGAVIFVHYFNK